MRPVATFKEMTMLDSIDSSLYPPRFELAFRALWRYIPEPLLHYVRYLPLREYRRLRTFLDYTTTFSRNLVRQSVERRNGKDMMSVLLRANTSENPNSKLTDDEVVSQISCVFTLLEVILLPFSLTHTLNTVTCSSPGMILLRAPYLGSFGRSRNILSLRNASGRRLRLSVSRRGKNSPPPRISTI